MLPLAGVPAAPLNVPMMLFIAVVAVPSSVSRVAGVLPKKICWRRTLKSTRGARSVLYNVIVWSNALDAPGTVYAPAAFVGAAPVTEKPPCV